MTQNPCKHAAPATNLLAVEQLHTQVSHCLVNRAEGFGYVCQDLGARPQPTGGSQSKRALARAMLLMHDGSLL